MIAFAPPNGVRYPRVGGTRQRHFAGTSLQPRELPENAQTPTRRVHAVLGAATLIFAQHLQETLYVVPRLQEYLSQADVRFDHQTAKLKFVYLGFHSDIL